MRSRRAESVGPWAKDKLDALARYLDYYTKVLKNQPWRTIYVDAYAGAGRAAVRNLFSTPNLLFDDETDIGLREMIDGSPRVALEVANPFDRYVFVEPDVSRARQLEALKVEYADARRIDVLNQNATSGVQWVLSQRIGASTHRGVVFLDPFGADLEWSVIEALGRTRVFEVVVNFALHMAIQRMLPNSGDFQPGWRERLNAYFGTPDWYSEVYQSGNGLLGRYVEKRSDYLLRLLQFYRRRLQQAFGHVAQPKLIRNTRGGPLYYLLWAGPHPRGLKGANYILSMGERLSSVRPNTRRPSD